MSEFDNLSGQSQPTNQYGQYGQNQASNQYGQYNQNQASNQYGQYGQSQPVNQYGQYNQNQASNQYGQYGQSQPSNQYGQYSRNGQAGQYSPYQNPAAAQNQDQSAGKYAQYRGQMYSGPKNPYTSKYEANTALCDHMKSVISSNMGFAAAIMIAIAFLLDFAGIFVSRQRTTYIINEVLLIAYVIEAWVTFGTAKWNNWEIKTGGIMLGKVFSVIKIVFSGIGIVVGIVLAIAGSVALNSLSSLSEEGLEEVLEEVGLDASLGTDINTLISVGSGIIIVIVLFALVLPLVLNIILNAKLNTFRNSLIAAIRRNLRGEIKTVGLAVILFIYGTLSVLGVMMMLIMGYAEGTGYLLLELSYAITSIMYIYSGVLILKFGKYNKSEN